MMKAHRRLATTTFIAMLTGRGSKIDDSYAPNASITLTNPSDPNFPEFNFNFRNERPYAICIPALYSSSTFGNLIIKSGDGNIVPHISDETPKDSDDIGHYYIIPSKSSISIRYDMSAYHLSNKQPYKYELFVRFVACKSLVEAAKNTPDQYEEAHFEGSFRNAR